MKISTRIPAASTMLFAIIPGMIAGLSSCTNSSHLLLYQHSTLGLNTGVNPSTQALHARIGIRREFGAIVPKYAQPKIDKNAGTTDAKPVDDFEAASAYFGSRFRVTSIWAVPEAAEVLATGQAAVLAASRGKLRLREDHDKVVTTSNTPPSSTDPSFGQVVPIPDIAGINTDSGTNTSAE